MIFITLLNFLACGDKTTEANNFPSCDEVETAVPSDSTTSLGFTPAEVAMSMPLSSTVGLEWADGTVDCLHYSLQLDQDSARDVASTPAEFQGTGPVPTIAVECNDYVAIDGTLMMSTPGGEISQEIDITMIYQQDLGSDEVTAGFGMQSIVLEGTYDPSNGQDDVEYLISVDLNDGLFTGALYMQTTDMMEGGDLAMVMNEMFVEWGTVDAPESCMENNE